MPLLSERVKKQRNDSGLGVIRVLIVCHDRYLSGANRALLDWLAGRDYGKADITVLLPRNNANFRAKLESLGCEVWSAPFVLSIKPLRKQGIVRSLKIFIKHAWSLCAHPVISRHIAKKAMARGIEIVHSNSFAATFGAEIAHAMGVPHVWHVREFCEADHGFTHYGPRRLASQCECSHAIFISDMVREHQSERYNFRSGIVVYDQVLFDSEIATERSFMEDGVCNVIMVGAISEGKGQIEAIESIKKLHDEGRRINLYLCGEGNRATLRSALSGSEKFIFDLGYREDVNRIRGRMDIALVCSRMEAFGRVTVEGQYYGNVVIGADAGCTPHLIDDGKTGYLYKAGDSEDLVEKIAYCMNNASLMACIAARAREEAIRVYAGGISEKIFEVYGQVLSSGGMGLLRAETDGRGSTR